MGMNYTVEGLDRLDLWAKLGKSALSAELQVSTLDLIEVVYEIIADLYPQNFLPYWQVTSNAPEEYLASITVKTNNLIVYWWEYGTNHSRPTVPVQRQALYFESKINGWVFKPMTYYIETRGVPAHNKRFELRDRLRAEVKARWGASMAAFFTSANA